MNKMSKMIEGLNNVIEELKSDLGEALTTADIWHIKDAQGLAGYNQQPKATALFNEVTRVIGKTLAGSEYPGLGEYYTVHLDNNSMVIVIMHNDYQLGMTVDLSKTTMGLLTSVVMPKIQKMLAKALS